jgi:hypothetical protein
MDNSPISIFTLPDQDSVAVLVQDSNVAKDIALKVIKVCELNLRSRCFAWNDQGARYLYIPIGIDNELDSWPCPASVYELVGRPRSPLADKVYGPNQLLDELRKNYFLACKQGPNPELQTQLDEFRQERLTACWSEKVRGEARSLCPAEWVRRVKEERAVTQDNLAERREEMQPSEEFRRSFDRW